MWRIPAPLIAGVASEYSELIQVDRLVGDLYTYLGSPPNAIDVSLTIDACDVGQIEIAGFAAGSTFLFTTINGGRILGVGGAAGDGGDDNDATGTAGAKGSAGGPAISCTGPYPVTVALDYGYLLGGGGGGGGGAFLDNGATGAAGGGGGGGQGYTGGAGGAGGSTIGTPAATAGTAGTRSAAGTAGAGSESATVTSAGGDGGIWGAAGHTGRSTDIITANGGFLYYGGLGGRAGRAFAGSSGATLAYSGAKSEATLRSEGRIKGDTSSLRVNISDYVLVSGSNVSGDTNILYQIKFQSDGDIETQTRVPLSVPPPSYITNEWILGTSVGIGASYEIRRRGLSGDTDGTFNSAPAATTWTALSSDVSFNNLVNYPANGATAALVEIRRTDLPAGADTNEHTESCYVRIAWTQDV